ncbi:MAG: tyrosine-type recombinase/integrase [Butyrivibrio sp.]|nr:tyrosine-type recombinase/integrase [Butyrivibrio sp.]
MSEIRGLTKSKSIDGEYITIREVMVQVDGVDVLKDMAKNENRTRRHRMPARIRELVDQVEGDVLVPMSPSVILKNLKKCMRDADLSEITFHDLRHINASVMAMLRVPDVYAQERGGWKSDHVMKNVYTEIFSEERQKVDDLIDGYFEKFV